MDTLRLQPWLAKLNFVPRPRSKRVAWAQPRSFIMLPSVKILLWRSLAVVSLLCGFVGAFVPIVPTVPFILLSAWAASKGWPRLEAWLLCHPVFGKSICEWRERGAVSRRAKLFAGSGMFFSAVILQFLPLPAWGQSARWIVPLIFICVFVWLWRRPEH